MDGANESAIQLCCAWNYIKIQSGLDKITSKETHIEQYVILVQYFLAKFEQQ